MSFLQILSLAITACMGNRTTIAPAPKQKQGRQRPKCTPTHQLTPANRKARYQGMKDAADSDHKVQRRTADARGTVYAQLQSGTLVRESPRRWEDKDRIGIHNNGVRRRVEKVA